MVPWQCCCRRAPAFPAARSLLPLPLGVTVRGALWPRAGGEAQLGGHSPCRSDVRQGACPGSPVLCQACDPGYALPRERRAKQGTSQVSRWVPTLVWLLDPALNPVWRFGVLLWISARCGSPFGPIRRELRISDCGEGRAGGGITTVSESCSFPAPSPNPEAPRHPMEPCLSPRALFVVWDSEIPVFGAKPLRAGIAACGGS